GPAAQVRNGHGRAAQLGGAIGQDAGERVFDGAVDVDRRGPALEQVLREGAGQLEIGAAMAGAGVVITRGKAHRQHLPATTGRGAAREATRAPLIAEPLAASGYAKDPV